MYKKKNLPKSNRRIILLYKEIKTMKKLSLTFIFLFTLSTFLFSEPFYDYKEMDEFVYLSKDNQVSYTIKTFYNSKYFKFSFIKESMITNVITSLNIDFENEQLLQKYTKSIDMNNMEKEFEYFYQLFLKFNIKPDNFINEESKSLIYRASMNSSNKLN
jgi:hypothetical protein